MMMPWYGRGTPRPPGRPGPGPPPGHRPGPGRGSRRSNRDSLSRNLWPQPASLARHVTVSAAALRRAGRARRRRSPSASLRLVSDSDKVASSTAPCYHDNQAAASGRLSVTSLRLAVPSSSSPADPTGVGSSRRGRGRDR